MRKRKVAHVLQATEKDPEYKKEESGYRKCVCLCEKENAQNSDI